MNDNIPPSPTDAIISRFLTRSAILEQQVMERVPELLKLNGAPKPVIDAVVQAVEPVINLQRETDREIVAALQAVPSAKLISEAFDAVVTRMERFAEDFSAVSNTTEQLKHVAGLREFVELTKGAEQGREPKGKDFERE